MDIAQWLTVIDRLCTREFPAEHARTDVGTGGPGYFIAELRTSGDFHEDGGAERDETEAQFEAERDGLGLRLAERWGPATEFSLYSLFERTTEGEDVPEPWATLSSHVPDVRLWTAAETGRLVALGISQWDRELPFQLLAVVTQTPP